MRTTPRTLSGMRLAPRGAGRVAPARVDGARGRHGDDARTGEEALPRHSRVCHQAALQGQGARPAAGNGRRYLPVRAGGQGRSARHALRPAGGRLRSSSGPGTPPAPVASPASAAGRPTPGRRPAPALPASSPRRATSTATSRPTGTSTTRRSPPGCPAGQPSSPAQAPRPGPRSSAPSARPSSAASSLGTSSRRPEPGGQGVAQSGIGAFSHPGDVAVGPDQHGAGSGDLRRAPEAPTRPS